MSEEIKNIYCEKCKDRSWTITVDNIICSDNMFSNHGPLLESASCHKCENMGHGFVEVQVNHCLFYWLQSLINLWVKIAEIHVCESSLTLRDKFSSNGLCYIFLCP